MRYFVILFFIALTPYANAKGPTEVLENAYSKAQEQKSAYPVYEIMNATEVFNRNPEMAKQMVFANTAEEYKTNMIAMLFPDPKTKHIRDEIDAKMAKANPGMNIPPEMLKNMRKQMFERQKIEMEKHLFNVEFKFGKAKITGDKALVPVTTIKNGSSKTSEIKMIKIDNKWYKSL